MTPLASLHHRLNVLRRRRRGLRWLMALAAIGLAILWVWFTTFAIDVAFELSVVQRIVLLCLATVGLLWGVRRFAFPWLAVRESETDVALFVQQQHGIDSDLVAALQFDRSHDATWGSTALRSAVVSRMADVGARIDVNRGLDYHPLRWRGGLLVVSGILAVAIALLYPTYLNIYFSRMLLSDRHYPTATRIERITVNGVPVWDSLQESQRPRDSRFPKGRPVTFDIEATGELVDVGEVECRSSGAGGTRRLELRRVASEPASATGEAGPSDGGTSASTKRATYLAELPHLVEGFDYTIRIGDAWTDQARLNLIEPPLVELAMEVTPPEYARGRQKPPTSPRHVAVLPGSRIELALRSLNEKRLKSAVIRWTTNETAGEAALTLSDAKNAWMIPSGTPFDLVDQECRFQIDVVDEDELRLDSPLPGIVQLKADRPPVVTASVVHQVLLPNARPTIAYRLQDDYGIADAHLELHVERQVSSTSEAATEPEKVVLPIPLSPSPLPAERLPYAGQFVLDLAAYELQKGDQVRLMVVASDARGQNAGEPGQSDPLLIEISDEAGVLAAITEADERSEKRLGDVIEQQLGVGGDR